MTRNCFTRRTTFRYGLLLLLAVVLTLGAAFSSTKTTTTSVAFTRTNPPPPSVRIYSIFGAVSRNAQTFLRLPPLCSTTTSATGTEGQGGNGGGAAAAAAATESAALSQKVVAKPPQPRPPCYYRTNSRWKQRIELANLSVGQELQAFVVMQEKLAGTKTGPKLWLDVGVGRYSAARGTWKICTAMLRLGSGGYVKESVARKKAARVRAKIADSVAAGGLSVYVSRIRMEQDQFEVVLSVEDLAQYTTAVVNGDAAIPQQQQQQRLLQSVSKLLVGDQVTGTVVRVEEYGVLVAIDGYNRAGLLHIQRVADLYGCFIDKKIGLEDAGLERGARVKLQVADSVTKKRLFLDFTDDVKEEAAAEQRKEEEDEERKREETRARLLQHRQAVAVTTIPSVPDAAVSIVVPTVSVSKEETLSSSSSIWKEEDRNDEGAEQDDEDDGEYDDYDEERDIEDALGLGSY